MNAPSGRSGFAHSQKPECIPAAGETTKVNDAAERRLERSAPGVTLNGRTTI